MADIVLAAKTLCDIKGTFNVPSYQRGYRWGKEEVERLLEDILNNCDESQPVRNYCLQPVVVRRSGDKFDLVDGQQRLTTLYLIYKFLNIECSRRIVPHFSLIYDTRKESAGFLEKLDKSLKDDNIDFFFIWSAYETIEKWFTDRGDMMFTVMTDINNAFSKYVKVIWYEVDESQDAIAMFTRLNIGKIPLTSAELIKAMFLSRDNNNGMDRERQEEIALQWDNIEKELHNDRLWYFLTNSTSTEYQTRIDLVLDLIARKPADTKDTYLTFFEFDKRRKNKDLNVIWQEILHTFLILKDWYENHELYHKIGYLIATRSKTLSEIYDDSKGQRKRGFLTLIDSYIKDSIAISQNYAELSYDRIGDSAKIRRLLLLFNVETVRKNGENTEWFPFDKFKHGKDGKITWSLEHIHAQQSQGMKDQKEWKEWLNLHIPSVQSLAGDNEELLKEMKDKAEQPQLERQEFEKLQEKVVAKLSVSGNVEYMHSIANLALLNVSDNAALSNSAFDVKRKKVIEMDKKGTFIPFCTKMVFLKYYTPSKENQIHFWGQPDRMAYIDAINTVLHDYLKEHITMEQPAEIVDEKEAK